MKHLLIILACLLIGLSQSVSAQTPQKNIAVIDLASRGGLSASEVGTLTDRLRSVLVRTRAFTVVDRGLMEEVLKEQGFQMSGCTSTDCAVEAGKILGVEQMVSGTIGRIGKLYTVDIILIDVGTSQIIKSLTRDYRGEVEGLVAEMKSIADELAGLGKPESGPVAIKQEIPKYKIQIYSEPGNAEVRINNKKLGQTPYAFEAKRDTQLKIELLKANYKPFSRSLLVSKNETLNIKLEYTDAYRKYLAEKQDEQKPQVKKEGGSSLWWWVGGGVAVAATAAYFLIPQSSTSAKDFPEPPARP